MVFSSTIFMFVFLPAVLGIYYLLDTRYRNVFLFICSLIFYAWGEPRFVIILIVSIMANYTFAIMIDSQRDKQIISKMILFMMIVFNVSIFFVFKYLNFVVDNINLIFGKSIEIRQIVLPIGISFFTFQAISYVIDVYMERGEVQKNPLDVGLYISFFPQLIAGPIVRYETVANQIHHRKENWNDFSYGCIRFIIGLGKKTLIANSMAIVADRVYNNINDSDITVLLAWVGSIAYSFQILFDFSGYSDMAIGLGRMFGFHFNENFNYPYAASSIKDFWRRWHISLSEWFRDYFYIPLGGSRKGTVMTYRNLFLTWLFTGIWHGANWTFILWGLLYFALLVGERILHIEERKENMIFAIFYRVFTLLMVNFAWVLFRSNNIGMAITYIKKMFGVNVAHVTDVTTNCIIKNNSFMFLCAIFCCIPISKWLQERFKNKPVVICTYGVVRWIIIISVLVLSVCSIISSSYNPFIYFDF